MRLVILNTIKLFFIVALLAAVSCEGSRRSNRIYLYSKDKSQIITIISNYSSNIRIIALGRVTSEPKENYVKVDISKITELGDEIGVCWFGKNNGWQLVNEKSEIMEVKLDTAKYVVKTSWERAKDGTPNAEFYHNVNCYTIGTLNSSEIYPFENGIIVRN